MSRETPALRSKDFKNWLHHSSLSREAYTVYQKVRNLLNAPPFNYGELSFTQDGETLEIMVDDGCGYRMPISSKRTFLRLI